MIEGKIKQLEIEKNELKKMWQKYSNDEFKYRKIVTIIENKLFEIEKKIIFLKEILIENNIIL